MESGRYGVLCSIFCLFCFSENFRCSTKIRKSSQWTIASILLLWFQLLFIYLFKSFILNFYILGLLTGTKLCFDFTTNFQNTFHALIRDLGDRGKLTSQISNPDSWMQDAFTTAPPTKPTADQLPSFSNWSVSRVGSWVVSIGLPHLATKLIELRVDGQCLLALRAYSAKELDEFVRAEFDLDLADTLKFRLNLSNLE
eukprot:c17156_g2_i2.p1 GENE.c17156_g2_i2~~c17156_g2_i2.p1  ORF type:complete len:198 (+),score=42.83 c17156_g2_i2:99-692(+)